MKEELKNIKTNVEEIAATKKEFDKKRRLFNLKVEEALEESEIKEFAEETLSDSYSRACVFTEYAGNLVSIIERIKSEHPKYGETRIRDIATKEYLGKTSSPEQISGVEKLLDNYFLYDNCGFNKVKALEEKLKELTTGVTNTISSEIETVTNSACSVLENPEQLLGTAKKKTKTFLKKTVKKTLKSILLDEEDD